MKPMLFLDFDRTLFDTDKFYEWIGEDSVERILKLTSGAITPPDFSLFLYADSVEFLRWARTEHQLVLLTYTINTTLQKKKIWGSGIVSLVDEVIMVSGGDVGLSGKGAAVKNYLLHINKLGLEHIFIDDSPQNIDEVKRMNPKIRCIRIDRVANAHGMPYGALLSPDYIVHDLNEFKDIL